MLMKMSHSFSAEKCQMGYKFSFLHGRIDEASIYDRALSGEEDRVVLYRRSGRQALDEVEPLRIPNREAQPHPPKLRKAGRRLNNSVRAELFSRRRRLQTAGADVAHILIKAPRFKHLIQRAEMKFFMGPEQMC